VFRPEREAQVLRGVAERNGGPLNDHDLQTIFREVMSACRALEKRVTVAYLGPAGTFSEQAVYQQFGSAVEGLPCASIDEVFRAAEAGTADFGVVPVENSSEGAVNRTLDLMLATTTIISGEVSIPVHHSLMSKSGSMDGITTICAHSQALAQCQVWLNLHHPGIARRAVASNAEAAVMASRDFVVIGQHATTPSGKDRTSLVLAVPNKAGAVYNLLAPLATHGVSMSRFESRPARTGNWEYYFYVDVEGHRQDAPVARALQDLQDNAAFYKLLGSYPVGL